MNTTFSFNRLGLLIKRYFIENKNIEITVWLSVIICFIFLHNKNVFNSALYIGGLGYAMQSFKGFSHNANGINYLMIPASNTEKLIAAILLTFYCFMVLLIVYIAGNFISIGIGHITILPDFIKDFMNNKTFDLFTTTTASTTFVQGHAYGQHITYEFSIWKKIIYFALIQAVFMLGALYFKINPLVKTLISISIIVFIISMFELFLIRIIFGNESIRSLIIKSESGEEMIATIRYSIKTLAPYFIVPFLWLVSYFRLTEKQL